MAARAIPPSRGMSSVAMVSGVFAPRTLTVAEGAVNVWVARGSVRVAVPPVGGVLVPTGLTAVLWGSMLLMSGVPKCSTTNVVVRPSIQESD
jgi:hypothetical protein